MSTSKKPLHIICLALPAWEAEYLRSTVELMKCLSKNNLVLYVDYAYTITDFFKGILGKKKIEWQRMLGIKNRLRQISGDKNAGLYLLSLPPVVPAFSFSSYKIFQLANKFNASLTGYFINRAAKKLNIENAVGFNSFQPFLGLWWKIKSVAFNIYYCYDDFTNVSYFKGFAAIQEKEFISKVDLLIVTSSELKIRKQQQNIPVEIVNNGVHFSDFNKYAAVKVNEDDKRKIIGYTGSIDNRVDIDLLEPVVKEMSDVDFVFIGKIFEQEIYKRLCGYSNVIFKPPVSAQEIPSLMSNMDVGIIPYVLNDLTAAIYPLKANEYLAMGMPVVMTPFASIGEADEVVYTSSTSNSFKEALQNAIAEKDESQRQRRIDIAKKADWQQRAAQLQQYIEKYFISN